jgi:O-antigen ligase
LSSTALHPVDLEPSLVAVRTYATRRRSRIDTSSVLCLMLALLFVLPGVLIVPNMTYAGRPALLVAFALFCWWILTKLNPRLVMTGPQPIRFALLADACATMLSYLAGLLRGLPGLEQHAQDFALLQLLEFLGIALCAADGIANWERLKAVLRVLVWGSAFMALVGIIQSVLKFDVTQYFILPGLQVQGQLAGFMDRGTGQLRVAGTATHFIEFSAVLAMVVPIAIHFARFSAARWQRRLSAVAAVLITAGVPISISRTGVVALGAVAIIMIPLWNWRLRYNLLCAVFAMTAALMVLRPGLLGTIRVMFSGADNDPSIEGRTKDYSMVDYWFHQRPWLGRGPNTLIPDLYQGIVLDNQWLYTLVTQGLVGVGMLAGLHITGIVLAGIALRRSDRAEDKHLCAALISGLVVSMLAAATFDSFYYTTLTSTVALLLGVCGAVWRFTHPARTVRTSTVRRFF